MLAKSKELNTLHFKSNQPRGIDWLVPSTKKELEPFRVFGKVPALYSLAATSACEICFGPRAFGSHESHCGCLGSGSGVWFDIGLMIRANKTLCP